MQEQKTTNSLLRCTYLEYTTPPQHSLVKEDGTGSEVNFKISISLINLGIKRLYKSGHPVKYQWGNALL